MVRNATSITGLLTLAVYAAPATAETVSLEATLEVSCTFVVTDGTLAPNGDYTELSSESSGGVAAQVLVTALGGDPVITFAAPSLTATGNVAGVVPQIKYSSTDGASQAYTSSSSFSASTRGVDTYTVHARAADASGFEAGDYAVTTVVTCSG